MFENVFKLENSLLLFENIFDLNYLSFLYQEIITSYEQKGKENIANLYKEKLKKTKDKIKLENDKKFNILMIIKPKKADFSEFLKKLKFLQQKNTNKEKEVIEKSKEKKTDFLQNYQNEEKNMEYYLEKQKKQFRDKLTKRRLNKRKPSIEIEKKKNETSTINHKTINSDYSILLGRKLTLQPGCLLLKGNTTKQKLELPDMFSLNFERINKNCLRIYEKKLEKINNILSELYDKKVKLSSHIIDSENNKDVQLQCKKEMDNFSSIHLKKLTSQASIIPDSEILSNKNIDMNIVSFFNTIIKYISI